MKKLLSLLLVTMLILGLMGCAKKEVVEETTTEPETTTETTVEEPAVEEPAVEEPAVEEPAKAEFNVALVTDTGGIDDKSFNQGTWEGIQRFSADTGAESVYAQSNSDADYIPNLSTFSEDGYGLIVAPGFLFADAIGEVSTNFPEQNFLIIDSVVGERPNVASAVFSEEQGSFLVGVAAAKATLEAGKDKVGFIGGMEFDLIFRFEAGFEAGVKAVDANITVLSGYVGDFTSADKGQSIASQMFDDGAYVVYHAAGGAGNGLIKEAKDRRTNGEDVWAIGVDKDQYADGIYEGEKSAVLTSMMKRVDVAAYTVAEMAMKGEFPGGEVLAFTLANGGVGIPETNPNLSADAVTAVADFEAKIKSGEIVVPVMPTRLQ